MVELHWREKIYVAAVYVLCMKTQDVASSHVSKTAWFCNDGTERSVEYNGFRSMRKTDKRKNTVDTQ